MTTIRIGLAQMNPIVGDFGGNVRKIWERVAEAEARGVDILVFPELAICGYPPEDLLLTPSFSRACRGALLDVAAGVRDLVAIVGTVDGVGDLHNAAAVIHRGRIVDLYHKVHLPNYGVFDELRYFQAGRRVPVYTLAGVPFTVTICEDMWLPTGPWVDAVYHGRARLVLNLSASPYHAGKIDRRSGLFATRAYENRVPVALCNLVGGQDELLFDGSSAVYGPDGDVIGRAPAFEESLLVVDIDDQRTLGARRRQPTVAFPRASGLEVECVPLDDLATRPEVGRDRIDPVAPSPTLPRLEELYRALVLGVRDYCRKNGFERVVIGLSGGIDSALTAAIAVDALGPEHVTGVTMPSRFNTEATKSDAQKLAENLGVAFHSVPIEDLAQGFETALAPVFEDAPRDVTEENIQARTRGNLLMSIANKWPRTIVLATGNKSEMATGYATLYGDMVGGFAPLKDVYKTTVFALSRHVNERHGREVIPQTTIDRPPSAELKEGQTDEEALAPYPVLDAILRDYLEEDHEPDAIASARDFDPALVRRIVRLVERNEYKRRQGAVGLKVSPRALAKDRRFPITHRFTRG